MVLNLRNVISIMVWDTAYESSQTLSHFKTILRYHNEIGIVNFKTALNMQHLFKEDEIPHHTLNS